MAARSIEYLQELRRATVRQLLATDYYSTTRRGLLHKLRNVSNMIREYEAGIKTLA